MQQETLLVIDHIEHKIGRFDLVFIFMCGEWIKSMKTVPELLTEWRIQAHQHNMRPVMVRNLTHSQLWKKTRPNGERI